RALSKRSRRGRAERDFAGSERSGSSENSSSEAPSEHSERSDRPGSPESSEPGSTEPSDPVDSYQAERDRWTLPPKDPKAVELPKPPPRPLLSEEDLERLFKFLKFILIALGVGALFLIVLRFAIL